MIPPVAVILPAAGKSSRFGGKEKKPFTNIDGRAVFLRTAELFISRPEVKQILLVISPEDRELVTRRYAANLSFLNIRLIEGGKERFESVANALKELENEIELVAVHDAVRPCTPPPVVEAAFQAAAKSGAAVVGIPIPDTVKRINTSLQVEATVPREGLWLAQTPQIFRKSLLLDAYAKRGSIREPITDDAMLIESLGHPLQMVLGSPQNLKITTKEDLFLAELYLKNRKVDAPKPRGPFDDEWMK
jgi:2-C-methyl-D-erythritol 4-phosphate cytidylyltransferase